jgi:DNA-binding transcriptional LysR family regulator
VETREILDHLEKIIACEEISRHGSLRRAAQAMNISQPSLSVMVKNTETILGVQLFSRTSIGIRLSEQGHQVVVFAREVIRLANELKFALAQKEQNYQGVVRLGIYESVARYFWPGFFKQFSKKFPGLKVQLTTGRSVSLIGKLRDRSIDVAITIEPPYDPRLSVTDLYLDSFSVYGHIDLLKEKFGKNARGPALVRLDEMEKTNLISFSDALADSGRPLIEELTRLGIPHENVSEVESFEIALEFCLQSLGLAVLPNRVAEAHRLNHKLKKIHVPGRPFINFSKHRISASILSANQAHPAYSTLVREIKLTTLAGAARK